MFYGEKLYEIREMFSYTRKELADELQLSEQLIWQFETNQITPDFMVINALKNLFHVRSSFFFRESYLENISETGRIAYRKKTGEPRNHVKMEKFFLDYFFAHIQSIEEVVYPTGDKIHSLCNKIELDYDLTKLSTEEIKTIAEEAREKLDIVTNKRLMYYMELSGIYIVERDLEHTIDAYSSWLLNDTYPVIVLNNRKNPIVRRNFDLGHELGHLLLHRYADFDQLNMDQLNKLEGEANLFSSYFTLPTKELKEDFKQIDNPTNPDSYISLKKKYRMSIQAIEYRANTEGWISKKNNRLFWKNINKNGYRMFEPLDDELKIHIPGKIRALLFREMDTNGTIVNDWLEKYHVDVQFFEKLFGLKDDLLRKHIDTYLSNYSLGENILRIKNI